MITKHDLPYTVSCNNCQSLASSTLSPCDGAKVLVKVGSWQAFVPERLASLIEEIWKAHISTEYSHYRDEGLVKIWFKTSDDLTEFLNIAAEGTSGPDSFEENVDIEAVAYVRGEPETSTYCNKEDDDTSTFYYMVNEVCFDAYFIDELVDRFREHNGTPVSGEDS